MILLAYPPFEEGGRSFRWSGTTEIKNVYFSYPPWFLAYSAALLEKENIAVDLVDTTTLNMTNDEFVDYVKKTSPELLITEVSTLTIYKDLELMKRIKEEVGCKIALTGSHATALCQEILLQNPFIDFVLFGEYELTVLELAMMLRWNRFRNILGLAYREGNKIRINKPRQLIKDLDSLPFPARHFLPMDRYNEAFAQVPNQQLLSSRGCPFRCVFCLLPQTLYNHTVRYRNPKKVVDEMQMLIEEYKPKEIYFDDDSFTLNPKHVLGVCKEIKDRNLDIAWSCMGHALITEDVLKTMVDAGCVGVKFGVETASQRVQKEIKKNLDVEQIKKFVKLAKKFNLRTHATYMLGLPGDTKETIEETLKLAVTLGTDRFQISIATPYPGTEFYNWVKKNGHLVTEDFSRYDGNKEAVVSYPNLSKQEIDAAFKKALDLTSKFDFGIAKYLIQQQFKERGPIRFVPFFFNEVYSYANRLLRKHIFTLKAKVTKNSTIE